MILRVGVYINLLLAVLLMVVLTAACGETVHPMTPTPTTSVSARPEQTSEASPMAGSDAVAEFLSEKQAIDQAWDQYHEDFDLWRTGLTNCQHSSVEAALRSFVSDLNPVVEQARDLPRTSSTREFADILKTAAEGEQAVFRQLRDHWQPGDVSLFEEVEVRRSEVAQARKKAEDMALDLRALLEGGKEPEQVEVASDFSVALDTIEDDWQRFYDGYSNPFNGGDAVDPVEVFARLDQLVARFDAIVADSVKTMGDVSQADKAAALGSYEDRLADLDSFDEDYQALLVEWDAFYESYDDWLEVEGGCDRGEVMRDMNAFSNRVSEIGRNVRQLPQSSYLLPIYNMVVEAAGREGGAIRDLQNSWRPFTVDAFKAVDEERANVARLRLQAGISLNELLDGS